MITFKEEFDIKEIYNLLVSENDTTLIPDDRTITSDDRTITSDDRTITSEDDTTITRKMTQPLPELGLKCIGFQSDIVLFSFNCKKDDGKVTKIGYFSLITKGIVLLYSHTEVIDVLVGSVNDDRNMLVYARKKSAKSSTYKSFLVELVNMKIFDLNIESPHTQHLLFLPWKNAKERGNRKEHLIFFLEKRRLGVIHVTTTENQADKIEVHQIQKEYLVQHYVWYQLDLAAMRLYYIYLQQCVSEGQVKNASSLFNVIQFSSRSNPEIVLSVKLPLPLSPQLYSAPTNRYMLGPASLTMPDSIVNITVLRPTSDIESLVLCIAYHAHYYVYLIHTGYLVECKHGTSGDKTLPIMFLNLVGYVVVYSPRHLLHVIDASSQHCIRNNMVFDDIPLPPALEHCDDFEQAAGTAMVLCPVTLNAQQPAGAVIVNMTAIYEVYFDPADLLSRYKSTRCIITWSFLHHLALSHLKDTNLTHRMVLHAMTTFPNANICDLLKEYLLASSHLSLSQQSDISTEVLSAVPYANENSQLAVLNRNRALKISNVFQTITKPMLSSQKVQNIVTQAGPFIRFNLEDFVSKCGYMVGTPPPASTSSSPNSYTIPSSSGATSVSSTEGSITSSHTESLVEEEDALNDTLHNALVYHIRRRFNETVQLDLCQFAAKLFFSSLARHTEILLSLALISVGKQPAWSPNPESLLDCGPEPGLEALLKLMDVMKFGLIQLGCYAPPSFEWIHVYTAYKSLTCELFLRRVASKTIRVTPSIIKKFLVTFSKNTSPEAKSLCSALISSVSRRQALGVLNSWDSTTTRRFYSQYQLLALRNRAGLKTPAEPVNETPGYLRAHPFIPVNSFFSYLYHKIPEYSDSDSRKLQALSEMSMEETRLVESDATLRGITF